MSGEKVVKYRFAVPVADESVMDWVEAQANLGFSLRVLIKMFMRDYGAVDATCVELGANVKKRGRPTKQSKVLLDDVINKQTDDPGGNSKSKTSSPGNIKMISAAKPRANSYDKKQSVVKSDTTDVDDRLGDINDILGIESSDNTIINNKPADNSVDVTDSVSVKKQDGNNSGGSESDDSGFVDPMDILNL